MTVGILPFGSGHSSIIFEHSLKTRLSASDCPSNWSGGLLVGSDALGFPDAADVDTGHGHWPTHDPELGLKQVSTSDGSTETGYRFNNGNGDADLISLGLSGCIMFEIESEAIDAYSATYNTDTYQPTTRKEPICCFSGSGNDNVRFIFIETGTVNPTFRAGVANAASSVEMTRLFTGWDLDATVSGDPKMYGFSKGRGRFVRVIIAWNGNFGVLMFQDPEDQDQGAIIAGWGYRDDVSGFAEHFAQFYMAGLNGTANTFLDEYYMRNCTLSTRFPTFSLSGKYPKVLGIGDSLLNFVEFATEQYGGINNGPYGVQRAFHSKALRTRVEFSQNGGQKVDESIVVTPAGITAVGTTATMTTSADPGWITSDEVSIAGATQPPYNGTFNITRVTGTSYTYTMNDTPIDLTATGTITAGRSLQVSVLNVLEDHPDGRGMVIHGLTNDLSSSETAADSLADYKSLIDKIFAADNMDFVICVIPPARLSGTDLDLQEEYNLIVFPGIKAYVAATYPTKIIETADVWTATGGRSQDSRVLSADKVHYAPYGASCLHWELYQAMLNVFIN